MAESRAGSQGTQDIGAAWFLSNGSMKWLRCTPSQCGHCEKPFSGRDRARFAKGEPQRHQVTELPPIEAHITEYQCHRLQCARCGRTTQAALPEEVKGNFGPELTALNQ